MQIIDLRSDTVTQPSAAMRKAMGEAKVGDDVYGEDPTVNRLEEMSAEITESEAALFVSSGTQGNLLALLSHCQRGDEYIVGQTAHTYKTEGGGAAVLGGIQPQPLDFEPDGRLDLDKVAATIKPDDYHFARTRLLSLENTQAGKVLPLSYLQSARKLTLDRNLNHHLDGARIFNATVKLNVPVSTITKLFDTTSICFSKGLGAPVGSVICGRSDLISSARRWRKVVGGGMRQAGILASAAIYALENNVERLAADHANAQLLAERLDNEIDEVTVNLAEVETNMVYAHLQNTDLTELDKFLTDRGVLIHKQNPLRLVTHLDVSTDNVHRFVDVIKEFYRSCS